MAKENVNELVDKLTLFDDDLMSRVFDNNIEATIVAQLSRQKSEIFIMN